MSMSKFTSQADYWKDRAERAEAKLAELEKQEPAYFVDEQGLLRKYTSRDFNQCNYGGLQRLYARPVPAEKGIVTVTTNDAGRWVMVSRQDEDHRILSVIWEAKPAEQDCSPPVLLADEELMQAILRISLSERTAFNIGRTIEAAVLRKNGLLREE